MGFRSPRGAPVAAGHVSAVQRWVDAGLLTTEQASAIARFEEERDLLSSPARISPGLEALAYVGGILVARDAQGKELSRSTFTDGVLGTGTKGTTCAFSLTTPLLVPKGIDVVIEAPGFGSEKFDANTLQALGYGLVAWMDS